ncbi:hypothetical protein BCV69DRAFT_301111 [Microstroma glucosiphilum]|uniref:Uncharacterized protein n=1 Tax=Pseudomicrostroma glucosiphilum TaxID=1684307 RepID=A0A316U081_9BASI|nr:hypothetical protein BCV69DRAFT_301111 [Pseudomicrostroma glucosiphilum]PWN18630.1 hypothetical protein BCV69DRAFT_301111 [Pseudomicrostroma glucosiphilum]
MYSKIAVVAALVASTLQGAAAYTPSKPTYQVSSLPNHSESGQVGTNKCTKYGASSQSSMCQNVFINSIHDFCLWAPSSGSKTIGDEEAKVVSYCMKSGYGTRLIPDGTIKRAHFVKTANFLQVTGYGDFTSMHVQSGDEGGELDPHGATGEGNPVGGLVFTRSNPYKSGWTQLHEWSNFMSATEFSFRACFDVDYATEWCPHIYDVMGSQWNHPGNYGKGFSQCDAADGEWPGVYSGSTFYQGQAHTPAAQKAGKSSNCVSHATISTGKAIHTPYRRSIQSFDDMEDDE